MNHADEQRNELDALSEIYFNEISVISNEPPISFSIKVRHQASDYLGPESVPDGYAKAGSDNDSETSEVENTSDDPWVELKFDLPEKYPDEKPSIQIINSQNLEENDLKELLQTLSSKVDESLGNVMIFTLVSDVVEWLIMISDREAHAIDMVKERNRLEEEKEERRKQEGTQVTVESFLAWKARFEAEMLKARLDSQKRQAEGAVTKRLTGREMFECDKTLAESDLNFVEELEQDQLEALLQKIDEVDIEDQDLYPFSDDDDVDNEDSDSEGNDFELLEESDTDKKAIPAKASRAKKQNKKGNASKR